MRKGRSMTGRLVMAILLGISIAAGVHMCCGAVMVCEAKAGETLRIDEKTEKEVEEFAVAFYEAHTKENISTLQDYVEDKESLPEHLLVYETAFSCGMLGYDNIEASAYPLDDGEYWLVIVCSDMIGENMDIGLPGAAGYVIHRKQDGSMLIVLEPDTLGDSFPDTLIENMRNLMLCDEIVEIVTEQGARYNEILAENEDIVQWVLSLSDALSKASFEAISGKDTKEESGLYTVKKGDCLWDIAEAELGDGMYWTRIYQENQDVIGDNPDLLFVGIQIRIDK